MIIIASQRSGARALADHLMNHRDNDHVTLAKVDGFMADDLHGALDEAYAVSKATQCTQFMFSVSLNPPEDAFVSEEEFEQAAQRIADKLGLQDQPRAMIIHEKQGRRHAHVVWSRIDADSMKAINLPHFKVKLRDVSKELFLDHGWELPKGLKTYGDKDPLNFTLEEWQIAQRVGVDPREMKQLFREAWAQSDDAKSLKAALTDKGLYLATGDRRAFVALDIHDNIYSLSRWMGVKAKDIKTRLTDAGDSKSPADVTEWLRARKTDQVRDYIQQIKDKHGREMQPFYAERAAIVKAQRKERADLKLKQDKRWAEETQSRSDRLNRGLRGLFDRLTGAHRRIIKRNEVEALSSSRRDQEQRDQLILTQMAERKDLQQRVKRLKSSQRRDRGLLARNIASYLIRQQAHTNRATSQRVHSRSRSLGFTR
ncbi:relaxase/mobilization nuclease domain-containing protein [uncultured Tateyamaria sp.]|uniref:relaxase/mobilization nuclease domain-containing protein n=1 Tax=uncultured Tateyamaria sp. TaxID=455651 RepID=UPI002601C3F2|nr:relaxase/mobilization nuclease domain-containing protein [uncultured Tateyamaria sp.]